MGCSILYSLAACGVTNTLLLEKNVLASGSTNRSQAILRMHYSNEVTTRMAWESLQVFRDFERVMGSPSGHVRTGYFLIVSQEDRRALEENVAMQRRLGVDTHVVTVEDVREMAPVLSVQGDEAFAYEPQSGFADPYSVTTGYAHRAREMGAHVKAGTAGYGYRGHRRESEGRGDARGQSRDAHRSGCGRPLVAALAGKGRRGGSSADGSSPGGHAPSP